MSEITLFEKGNALPSYIKNVQSNLSGITAAIGGSSGKIISIRGSVWRLMVNGEQVSKNEERSMKFVIVGVSEKIGRNYYEAQYEEGKEAAPVCWSADGKTPSPKSQKPQASTCESCPQNIAGSGQRDSRACRFIRSLAVVLPQDMGGDVYRLNMPATSMFGKDNKDGYTPFEAFCKAMKGYDVPIDCVITEVKFDSDSSTPKMLFKPVRALTEEEYHICQEQGAAESTKELVTIDFAGGMVTSAQQGQPSVSDETAAVLNKAKATKAKVTKPTPVEKVVAEEVEEDIPEPTKRASTKTDPVADKDDAVSSILDEWETDDDE